MIHKSGTADQGSGSVSICTGKEDTVGLENAFGNSTSFCTDPPEALNGDKKNHWPASHKSLFSALISAISSEKAVLPLTLYFDRKSPNSFSLGVATQMVLTLWVKKIAEALPRAEHFYPNETSP